MRDISLQTVPNGYALSIGSNKYMYFNEMELLSGFLVHVGLCNETPMEGTKMLRILFQTLIGQEYTEVIENMMQMLGDLEKRCQEAEKNLRQLQDGIKAAARKPGITPKEPIRRKARKNKVVIDSEDVDINDEAEAKLREIEERLKNNPNIK